MTEPNHSPGYRTRVRTKDLVCDWEDLLPEEGCEPLRVTVKLNLTAAEQDAIPSTVRRNDEGTGIIIRADDSVREAIAPYVLAWNAEALNRESGQVEPVPPPAEAGPVAFRALDWQVAAWIAAQLKVIHVLPDPKGMSGSPPPASTAATSPDAAST